MCRLQYRMDPSVMRPEIFLQDGSTGAAFDTELIKGKPMKDIKDIYGFSPGQVREWVAAELGQ